jgi:hypothetical protein
MTELRLRVDLWGVEEGRAVPDHGVVANVYDVTTAGRKDRRQDSWGRDLRNLVIPAGPMWEQEEFLSVELPSGEYLVEAILPSGRVISEEVTLQEGDESWDVRLYAGRSPYEWLGWQYFVGNMAQDERVYHKRRRSAGVSVGVRTDLVSALTPPPAGPPAAEPPAADGRVSRGFFFDFPAAEDVDTTRPLADFFPLDAPDPPAQEAEIHTTHTADEITQMHAFDTTRVRELQTSDVSGPDDYSADRLVRHYLFVRGHGISPQYSVLPVPWMMPDFSGEAVVEALVRSTAVDADGSPGVDQGHRIAITVRDRLVGSVIGYLGSGDLPAAATITTRARDMLWGKRVNPLAAAAGAYVLMSGGTSRQPNPPAYWHQWVRNLINWFEWLPDGAIQHAWLILRQQDDEESLRRARRSLLEGYRRGLPFYSKGVGLLLDGLTLFANDARAGGQPDEEVEEALRTVRKLALRTNAWQPFTTVLLR